MIKGKRSLIVKTERTYTAKKEGAKRKKRESEKEVAARIRGSSLLACFQLHYVSLLWCLITPRCRDSILQTHLLLIFPTFFSPVNIKLKIERNDLIPFILIIVTCNYCRHVDIGRKKVLKIFF